MQAKIQTDAKHNLAEFSLLGDSGTDTFSFDGKNWRNADKESTGNFINLPQRQRKRNYDLSAAEKNTVKAHASDTAAKKRKKGPALHDFQLFDLERLAQITTKERELVDTKEEILRKIRAIHSRASSAPSIGSGVAPGQSREELQTQAAGLTLSLDDIKLSDEVEQEKERLLNEGFPDWSRKDFRTFCTALGTS